MRRGDIRWYKFEKPDKKTPGATVEVLCAGVMVLDERLGGLDTGSSGDGTSKLTLPVISFLDDLGGRICMHHDDLQITSEITGDLCGNYKWIQNGSSVLEGTTASNIVKDAIVIGELTLSFYPDNAEGSNSDDPFVTQPMTMTLGEPTEPSKISKTISVNMCDGHFCVHGVIKYLCPECMGLPELGVCPDCHYAPQSDCPCSFKGGKHVDLDEAILIKYPKFVKLGLGPIGGGHHDDCGCGCTCFGHGPWWFGGYGHEGKTTLESVDSKLKVKKADGTVVPAGTEIDFEMPEFYDLSGVTPSTQFDDALINIKVPLDICIFKTKNYEYTNVLNYYTVASIFYDEDLYNDQIHSYDKLQVRGGEICTNSIDVHTYSYLTEGFVRLASQADNEDPSGLVFSETENCPIADAVDEDIGTPPGTVSSTREFYLGSLTGGVYNLEYELVDDTSEGDSEYIVCKEEIEIEVILPKLAEEKYYLLLGESEMQFDLATEAHDPDKFTLIIGGTQYSSEYNGGNINLSSLQPGTYSVTLRSNTFTDMEDTATLYISEVILTAENSARTQKPLKECMEGRSVTFTATATGFESSATQPITFTFNYEEADGTQWSSTDYSYDLVEDNTAVADDVLDGDEDHSFETPISVRVVDHYSHDVTSPEISVKVYELWIKTFKDVKDPDEDEDKDWKVVVGEPIEYEAIASPDCGNWVWEMPDTMIINRRWNPAGGNRMKGQEMVIPNSDMPEDEDWDHFGDSYGTVKVTCTDEEGNTHSLKSSDMTQSKKAEVYFDGSLATHPGAVLGSSKNWFYYWKYALIADQYSVDISYSRDRTYGTIYFTGDCPSGFIRIGDNGNRDYIRPYNHVAETGLAAAEGQRESAEGKDRIDLFYSVLIHEIQHWKDNPLNSDLSNLHDSDSDLMPDTTFDPNVSFDPHPQVINGAGYEEYKEIYGNDPRKGDWEKSARNAENVTAPIEKDWSKDGRQW